MAAGKKSNKSAITRLTPDSVDVEGVRVPANRGENVTMNAIMIAQGRKMIQDSIKKWGDMDEVADPRQLKDVITAMKNLVEASNIVYPDNEGVLDLNREKKVETTEPDDVSFDALHTPPEVKEDGNAERNPPEADGS